jgi:hypothetical protein
LVRTLFQSQEWNAGRHTVSWNGISGDGLAAASGVYRVRLDTDAGVASQSAVLLK